VQREVVRSGVKTPLVHVNQAKQHIISECRKKRKKYKTRRKKAEGYRTKENNGVLEENSVLVDCKFFLHPKREAQPCNVTGAPANDWVALISSIFTRRTYSLAISSPSRNSHQSL
jgi:hypothetical protein